MRIEEIKTPFIISGGAPLPHIISNDNKVFLFFFSDAGDVEHIVDIVFSNCRIYKSGYPNDEVLNSHPYYKLGLTHYGIFQVINSNWIDEIEGMNSIHPLHDKTQFEKLKHYVITFKDSTFECIAESFNYKIEANDDIKNAMLSAVALISQKSGL